MTRFGQALKEKDFVVTVELEPPKGSDLEHLQKLAQELSSKVDAVVLADNPRAEARLDPVITAHRLLRDAEVEVILTLTCRDRNRLALTSQMLGAAAAEVETLFIVSGDFVSLGDHPGAKPVYDLDPVQALQLARRLGRGQDLAGHDLQGVPSFVLGAGFSPRAEPRGAQMLKLRKKLQAGAEFIITMPVADQETYQELRSGIDGVKLIAGLAVEDPSSRDAVSGLAKQLKSAGADGVHISMPADQEGLPAFLSACGL